MLVLSVAHCITSFPYWLPFSFGENFPNCVSCRLDSEHFAAGALSHDRVSTLFLTRAELEPGRGVWYERADWHFCSFDIPTTEFNVQPSWFSVVTNQETIGWHCPYFLMISLWGFVYCRCSDNWHQWRILDLIGLATILAVICCLIQCRMQLLLTIPMNIATLMLIAVLAVIVAKSALDYCKSRLLAEPPNA